MSATDIQSALSTKDWHLDFAYHEPSGLAAADPNIDDPVNNTGLGPRRGDLHLSDEFARFVKVICEEGGEFS